MDAFSRWQSAFTFILAVAPWFLPDIAILWKIIIVLLVLLISCSLYCLRLQKRVLELNKEHDRIKSNHQALSRRFDEKRADINQYEQCLNSIEYLIVSTVQTTKQDRLTVLYDSFLKIKAELISNGKADNNG